MITQIEIPDFEVRERDDIQTSLQHPVIKERIEKYNNSSSININQTMEELNSVGILLGVAIAGSKGFPCSVGIVHLLSEFQSLVNLSYSTMDTFIETSISALANYSCALSFAKQGGNKSALNFLCESCEDAEKMEELSGKLVDLSQSLIRQSEDALLSASNSNHLVEMEFQDKTKELSELKLKSEELSIDLNRYKDALFQIKKDLDGAKSDQRLQEFMSLFYKIINIFMPLFQYFPTSTFSLELPDHIEMIDINRKRIECDSEVDEKKETLYIKQRKLQELEGKSNGSIEDRETIAHLKDEIRTTKKKIKELKNKSDLLIEKYIKDAKENAAQAKNKVAEYGKLQMDIIDIEKKTDIQIQQSIEKIKKLEDQNNHLGIAIQSLDITIKNLGIITTSFKNTQLFWTKVKKECHRLINMRNLEILCDSIKNGDNSLFIKEIRQYGLKWLSFAHINLKAYLKIEEVKRNVDKTMCNLPSKEEARTLIVSLSDIAEKNFNKKIRGKETTLEFIRVQMEHTNNIDI